MNNNGLRSVIKPFANSLLLVIASLVKIMDISPDLVVIHSKPYIILYASCMLVNVLIILFEKTAAL